MESPIWFKFHKTSWGIFVNMSAEFIPCDLTLLDASDKNNLPVTERLWLQLYSGSPCLTQEEKQMLVLGARLIADNLSTPFLETSGVIEILELRFSETEYQPEGLACVMAEWIAREWGVPLPNVPVRYDKPRNVYFFKFPGLPEMGTHAIHGKMTAE